MASENKTQPTKISVNAFLNGIVDKVICLCT